jgi:bifunctional UDP-N-acetylglucosamine pyrophosphorylase/glucosamine-1-phosphate N-acetyltransferase
MWWRDLETRRALVAAGDQSHIDETSNVEPGAVLDDSSGPIRIGALTRVCGGAIIKGPVTIGERCLIGNLAMVRGPTSIGDDVCIGFASEIKASVVERRVSIGPQCFVADSWLEEEAYLGAQVRTSNHRLDRRNVSVLDGANMIDSGTDKLGCQIGARSSLGIQVIILPGRVIAPNSTFAPRVTVEKNLPTGRYRLSQTLESF